MLKASFDNVIVKVIYEDKPGLIYIPEKFEKQVKSFTGEVVSIGPLFKHDLKVGDLVLFPRNEGFLIAVGDQEYYSLRESWVLAKIQ